MRLVLILLLALAACRSSDGPGKPLAGDGALVFPPGGFIEFCAAHPADPICPARAAAPPTPRAR